MCGGLCASFDFRTMCASVKLAAFYILECLRVGGFPGVAAVCWIIAVSWSGGGQPHSAAGGALAVLFIAFNVALELGGIVDGTLMAAPHTGAIFAGFIL